MLCVHRIRCAWHIPGLVYAYEFQQFPIIVSTFNDGEGFYPFYFVIDGCSLMWSEVSDFLFFLSRICVYQCECPVVSMFSWCSGVSSRILWVVVVKALS